MIDLAGPAVVEGLLITLCYDCIETQVEKYSVSAFFKTTHVVGGTSGPVGFLHCLAPKCMHQGFRT